MSPLNTHPFSRLHHATHRPTSLSVLVIVLLGVTIACLGALTAEASSQPTLSAMELADLRAAIETMTKALAPSNPLTALACASVARGTADASTLVDLYTYPVSNSKEEPKEGWTAASKCATFYESESTPWRNLYNEIVADDNHPGHAIQAASALYYEQERRSEYRGQTTPSSPAEMAYARWRDTSSPLSTSPTSSLGQDPLSSPRRTCQTSCVLLGSNSECELETVRRLIEAFARFVFSEPSAHPHDRLIVGRHNHPVGNHRDRADPHAVDVVRSRLARAQSTTLDAAGAWYEWLQGATIGQSHWYADKPVRELPVSYALLDEGYCEGYHKGSTYAAIVENAPKWAVRLGAHAQTRHSARSTVSNDDDLNLDHAQPVLLMTYTEFEHVTRDVLDIGTAIPWLGRDTLDAHVLDALQTPAVEAVLRALVDGGIHAAATAGESCCLVEGKDCADLPRFSDVFDGPLYLVPVDGDHLIALLVETRSDYVESLVAPYDPARVQLYEGPHSRPFSHYPT